MKEEILTNLLDKYHDLLEEGKSQEAAYSIAVASIGDMQELLAELQKDDLPPDSRKHKRESDRGDKENRRRSTVTIITNGNSHYPDYPNADKYQAGNAEFEADKIKDINIHWLAGDILVEAYDGKTASICEQAPWELKEKERLHYFLENGLLNIQYWEAQGHHDFFTRSKAKKLIVRLPAETAEHLGYISIDATSSDITMNGIKAGKICLESISGDCKLKSCQARSFSMDSTSGDLTGTAFYVDGSLDTNTISGDVHIEGSFKSVDADTVSGDIAIRSVICPDKVSTDAVSADTLLVIPENNGFTCRTNSVSGSINCQFDTVSKGGKKVYKNGEASFRFDSVSGDISIQKLK